MDELSVQHGENVVIGNNNVVNYTTEGFERRFETMNTRVINIQQRLNVIEKKIIQTTGDMGMIGDAFNPQVEITRGRLKRQGNAINMSDDTPLAIDEYEEESMDQPPRKRNRAQIFSDESVKPASNDIYQYDAFSEETIKPSSNDMLRKMLKGDLCKLHIGKDVYVVANIYHGQTMVNIRVYEKRYCIRPAKMEEIK